MPLISSLIRVSPNNRSELIKSDQTSHSPDHEYDPETMRPYIPSCDILDRFDLNMNQHGTPGDYVTYTSGHFGDIGLSLDRPINEAEENRFGQHLWNAAILMAITVEAGSLEGVWKNEAGIDVKDMNVIELGAGAGLVGVMAALSRAKQTAITDHSNSDHLANIKSNVTTTLSSRSPEALERTKVHEHAWGDFDTDFCHFSQHHYGIVLASDCLWISDQHDRLISSIKWFLKENGSSKLFLTAGFHTGRDVVKSFFDKCAHQHLKWERIWEQDTIGNKRIWNADREETMRQSKRWTVMAELRRNPGTYESIMAAQGSRYDALPAIMPNGLPYRAGLLPNSPSPSIHDQVPPSPPSTPFFRPAQVERDQTRLEVQGDEEDTDIAWFESGGMNDDR